MVSTRGGTRTSAPDDASTMLRKKPVRKVTAKAAPATSTAAKAKATRSKKTEPEPEVVDDDEPDELQEEAPAPTKTTRKVTTRAKKSEEPVKPATTKSAASKAPSKPAKAATRTTRGKAAEEVAEQNLETKKPELKPTTQSTVTRATRATAAKDKAAPLSPKKITQVSKAPARSAKTSVVKGSTATAKAPAAKAAKRGRPPGRRRNVSDENAVIPEFAAPAEVEGSDIEVAPKKPSGTRGKNAVKRAASPMVIDNDTPISTRPATPAESLQETHDEHDHDMHTTQQSLEDHDDDESEQSSQDELSGPKSPMRRVSPREPLKYASAKEVALPDIDVPMKTPVRRFAVLGTQQGTPQTQKPYCKPAVPLSNGKPMTVARAQSRAMVFPRLQPLGQAADDHMDVDESSDSTSLSDQSTPIPRYSEAENSEAQDEASESQHDMDPDLSLLVDPENRITEIESTDDMLTEVIETQTETIRDESAIELGQEQRPQADADEHTPLIEEDPDETIVTHEGAEDDASPAQDTSYDSFESVIVNRPDLHSEDDGDDFDVSLDDDQAPPATPQPETLVWENIRDDVTIPFSFDANVSPTRDLVTSDSPSLAQSDHAVSDDLQDDSSSPFKFGNSQQAQRESTVRLSEFVDITSLADSRRRPEAEAQADGENSTAARATVEDGEDSQWMIDGDVTMVCAAPATPRTVKRSPVRLTTIEHVDEDEMLVDGDVTLMLDRHESPASAKRSPVKLTTVEHVDDQEEVAVDGEMSLLLEQPDLAPSVRPSPIKLSTAEDYPEEEQAVAGDETLVLEDHQPTQPTIPATPVLVNDARASDVTSIDLQDAATPHYALPTFSSTREPMGPAEPQSSTPNAAESPVVEAWFDEMQSSDRKSQTFASRPSAAKERMPALGTALTYEELLENSTGDSHTPASPTNNEPAVAERYPGIPSRETYENVDDSSNVRMTPRRISTIVSPALRTQTPEAVAATTPQPVERFPGLPAKRSYEEHAKTAMPATRFATPERRSTRRPATAQKATSLRKLALTSNGSRTPIKSPLKAPAETPAQIPMTPHPGAPLKGVVALVDVYTSDGGCATGPFSQLLQRLGAKTTKTFSDRVTHVVFKDGHPKLLQSLVIHNKQVANSGSAKEIFCVNSRWVNDCDINGVRMTETDEAYAIDVDDAPRVAKRRRKSMEPMSLLNNGGNIVRDRKSSIGRVSIGRLSSKTFDIPSDEHHVTPKVDPADKENSGDSEACSSPATPAYISAPEKLVQQTAPMNRIRKLDLNARDQARRLTFTNMEF
ncbi:uncharacterized protein MYCFIDRAFT_192300 [Pseudocercospora fijiensis CIRAD86]|uniref:BRCT domain-containing protein n=1 Tax=Pseudocercospora fijiensis (strain CIRAD86) TaxID=383855 RepID=N1QAN4_PSEFD|nr:uncharacterized protein MYCFIDRAFT_192300 [Pseudocercospora fijiensis CIRAD86]EME88033.1 hypothetical protein MYCFIDRAFT_192300 [Pseudocercospora fijiensis CIRAD86]